jgi:hypothetical protein
VLCVSVLWGPPAGASPDPLRNARNTFEYGSYEDARRLAEELLTGHRLAEERDLVEAYRIIGLSHFYLNHTESARRSFIELLSVDPDFTMDPLLVPPAAVAFFDGVKRDKADLLAPIRERRRVLAEQERLAAEARRRLLEESLRRQTEPDRPVLVQRVETRTFVVNLLPFGAGQFQEGRPAWGAGFAGAQVAALVVSGVSYGLIESLRNTTSGRFTGPDYGKAKQYEVVKFGALAAFGALYVGGVVESLLRYQGSESRIEALAQPQARPLPEGVKLPPPEPPAAEPAPAPVPAVEPAPEPRRAGLSWTWGPYGAPGSGGVMVFGTF